MKKKTAPRNKTIRLTKQEEKRFAKELLTLSRKTPLKQSKNRIIFQDMMEALELMPDEIADLVILDPPYNLTKEFNTGTFSEMQNEKYTLLLEQWLGAVRRKMKPNASIYICGDWRSSAAIYTAADKYFNIINRITWEREKGRGAKKNWKNCSEDIWYCTMNKKYTFNLVDVKMKRRVIAPYTTGEGKPKDWENTPDGNYRITHPSNLWTDISVPFWSMPENTEHPTQKPEKLLAKLILASSNKNDIVLDPFMGSGSTLAAAKKLGRNFIGIEKDRYYCCVAAKRLELAKEDKRIQGYSDGVFWERNSLTDQMRNSKK